MRLFDSSLINRLILLALKEKPLQHKEIVNILASSKELDLTPEEREEKESSTGIGVFSHKVAGQEQSLKRQGLIDHDDVTKEWKIQEKGRFKLNNDDIEVVNNDDVFKFFCKKSGFYFPKNIKKEIAQQINYLCEDKVNKELIVIDINPIINDNSNPIKQLQDRIRIVEKSYPSKAVRGILIIKEDIVFEKNGSAKIEIIKYVLDLRIENGQTESDDEVLPSSENAFSNYLINNLAAFKNVNMDLAIDENIHPREYPVCGRRSIDVLCRDYENKLVVIENKINTNTEYHVVGQILYYLYHMKDSFPDGKFRGIILIPNKNTKEKSQTIRDALQCKRSDLIVDLLFYSLSLKFL